MPALTVDQKWELLRTWAQTLANHAQSKDADHLRQDLEEVTNAVNMILTNSQYDHTVVDQVAEIDSEISLLEQQNLTLESRADRLSDLPRSTALEQADITSQIRSNSERIQQLQAKKTAMTGSKAPA